MTCNCSNNSETTPATSSNSNPLLGVVSPAEYSDTTGYLPREGVLDEARHLITGDRNQTYGSPTENFHRIADLWNIRFAHMLRDDQKFSSADVAESMILLKIARNVTQTKRDNYVDLAGYAACAWECIEEEEERK